MSSPVFESAAGDAAQARAPRRARGQLRVDALLASAAEVFAQKGFDAATMTEIAAQADSSIGSLYQFFRTKEAVAEALLRVQADALLRCMDGLAEQAAQCRTAALSHALVRLLVDFRAAHPSYGRLVETPGTPTEFIAELRRTARVRVAGILHRHAPTASPELLQAMAPVVVQAMKAAVQLHADLDPAPRAASMHELDAMLLGYLGTRLGARQADASGGGA